MLHIRRATISLQDQEFFEGLALDQQRDHEEQAARERRRATRQGRRHNREQRQIEMQEVRQQKLERVGEEPTDNCFTVVFVLQDNTTKSRKFRPEDKKQSLFDFIEGSTCVNKARLLFGGNVVEDSTACLKDCGIGSNCRIHVEDLQDNRESLTESEDDADDTESVPVRQITTVNDIKEFDDRVKRARDFLCSEKIVRVRRDNIVENVLDRYRTNPNLVHHRIKVVFEREEVAEDFSGVTREMFSAFFSNLLSDLFDGDLEKIPRMDAAICSNDTMVLVGKIISHAYVLTGIFPIQICKSAIKFLLCGNVAGDETTLSFLRVLSEDERAILKSAMADREYMMSVSGHLSVLRALGPHCSSQAPSPNNLQSVLTSVAETAVLLKPFWMWFQLHTGMRCYPSLWMGLSGQVVEQMFDRLRPTPAKVLECISSAHSDDTDLQFAEYRVYGYLEQFISSLNAEKLERLLQFWTAADILLQVDLLVAYNSLQGTSIRPIANTCSQTLQLSRFYVSYQDFKHNMDCYIFTNETHIFDSV
ncbi:PREDICTED: uncharacterized protein LOC106814425 [Priapulus caudatus]|uniref:Uncharacterized protein LOC106814425 n=1 Tax=Priapulus caudatus TaxID=37621 RepID=A0ABM1EPV7_PRICU|nr:PREDICTED: uncharacterized protein LOC106814425 [Priapulus caudatus]